MKKILSIALALIMILAAGAALASCTKPEKEKLVMATNATFPPYEFYEGTKLAGIDVELGGKIAEKLGMELEIKDVGFDTIIAGIESGSYTIGMAGMTVTETRLEKVNFSTSYAKGVQVVIVKEGSGITSIDDLTGKKIGVQQGTTGDIYASDTPENGGFGEENVSKFQNGPDAVQALVSGSVDAVIIDNEPAKNYVAANAGLTILPTAYADEDYAIAISKSNTELLAKINQALKELKDDGTIDAIVEKYIPSGK